MRCRRMPRHAPFPPRKRPCRPDAPRDAAERALLKRISARKDGVQPAAQREAKINRCPSPFHDACSMLPAASLHVAFAQTPQPCRDFPSFSSLFMLREARRQTRV